MGPMGVTSTVSRGFGDYPSSIADRTQAIQAARKGFDAGLFNEAIRICDHLLRQDARDAEVAMLRFDLHVRNLEFEAAYHLIGPFVQPGAATDLLLRAAFATAYTGRTRLDMKEFCEGFLPFSLDPHTSPFLASRSLKSFRLSASLAVGTEARLSGQARIAEMYLKLTLHEDASEPIVASLLSEIYLERGENERALDALVQGRIRMTGREARNADQRIRRLQRVVSDAPKPVWRPQLRTA